MTPAPLIMQVYTMTFAGTRWPRLLGFLGALLACAAPDGAPPDRPPRDLPLTVAPARPAADKLSPGLRAAATAGATEPRRVVVDLATQLDLAALGARLQAEGADKKTRRQRAIEALDRVASTSRHDLDPTLRALARQGSLEFIRHYTVVNRFLVTATVPAVLALAERDEVAALTEETETEVGQVTHRGERARGRGGLPASGTLELIGADSAWALGLDGAGVVVGVIDAGASAAHEQLGVNYRGREGAGERSWYDPMGGAPTPVDGIWGHGTSVLSVAVGANAGGRDIGVAPRAQWVACVGLPGGRYNNVALIECADWMLTRGRPDVLVIPWVLPNEGCDRDLQRVVDAWRAAEILPVFAAGNLGPAAGSDRSPANYVGLYPGAARALSVGGVDGAAPYAHSSRGPNSCDGSTYPVLVAPAVDITVAHPLSRSTYIRSGGTSVASGLVAGAAALLLQRHPQALATDMEMALTAGAVDLGPPGPDDAYGFGRLYVPAALDALARLLETAAAPRSPSEISTER